MAAASEVARRSATSHLSTGSIISEASLLPKSSLSTTMIALHLPLKCKNCQDQQAVALQRSMSARRGALMLPMRKRITAALIRHIRNRMAHPPRVCKLRLHQHHLALPQAVGVGWMAPKLVKSESERREARSWTARSRSPSCRRRELEGIWRSTETTYLPSSRRESRRRSTCPLYMRFENPYAHGEDRSQLILGV